MLEEHTYLLNLSRNILQIESRKLYSYVHIHRCTQMSNTPTHTHPPTPPHTPTHPTYYITLGNT